MFLWRNDDLLHTLRRCFALPALPLASATGARACCQASHGLSEIVRILEARKKKTRFSRFQTKVSPMPSRQQVCRVPLSWRKRQGKAHNTQTRQHSGRGAGVVARSIHTYPHGKALTTASSQQCHTHMRTSTRSACFGATHSCAARRRSAATAA